MRAVGLMGKDMEKGAICLLQAKDTRVSGNSEREMAEAVINSKMEVPMKDNGNKTFPMAVEHVSIKMEISTAGYGWTDPKKG